MSRSARAFVARRNSFDRGLARRPSVYAIRVGLPRRDCTVDVASRRRPETRANMAARAGATEKQTSGVFYGWLLEARARPPKEHPQPKQSK